MASETHIAGVQLSVKDRYLIQRCSWCGAVMLSYDLTRVARPLEPGEDPEHPNPWTPSMFEVGKLVRFTYDGPVASFGEVTLSRTMAVALDLDRLPDDACTEHIPFDGEDA